MTVVFPGCIPHDRVYLLDYIIFTLNFFVGFISVRGVGMQDGCTAIRKRFVPPPGRVSPDGLVRVGG